MCTHIYISPNYCLEVKFTLIRTVAAVGRLFDAGNAGRGDSRREIVFSVNSKSMTPEKRPVEDEDEQDTKKLKEEDTPPSATEVLQDDTSQDSVASDSATSSDPEKKVSFVMPLPGSGRPHLHLHSPHPPPLHINVMLAFYH